jgi:Zn-dependent M28 family amino/carboxypeptidase
MASLCVSSSRLPIASSSALTNAFDRQHSSNDGVSLELSDQYSFIKQGVPSLAIGVGFDESNKQVQKDWLTHRYHAPSDDLNQPKDLATAGKYETIMRDLVVKVADLPQKPEWKTDSFFRRYADSPGR